MIHYTSEEIKKRAKRTSEYFHKAFELNLPEYEDDKTLMPYCTCPPPHSGYYVVKEFHEKGWTEEDVIHSITMYYDVTTDTWEFKAKEGPIFPVFPVFGGMRWYHFSEHSNSEILKRAGYVMA